MVQPHHYETGVPVFMPTYEEFADFYAYNKEINQYGMQSGIVKVIPPAQWTKQLEGIYTTDNLRKVKIKNPIVQHINGVSSGVYTSQNVEKQRSFNLQQWLDLSRKPNNQPPPESRRKAAHSTQEQAQEPPSYSIDVSQYTPERCEELEKNYWRTLTYAEPTYGADMLGSLFPSSVTQWNVASLPNILDLMKERIPGVNDAYLYAGLWKATFAWHLEDQDLYSINYIHFGAPKQWYSIPQRNEQKFFALMKDTFADEYKNCSEFLRHKTFNVSPQFLEKHGVEYNKIVHREGEFMITYPYGYHAGFNYGYNLAESVNFALDDWFPIGRVTRKCECIADSVGINVDQLWRRYTNQEDTEGPHQQELKAEPKKRKKSSSGVPEKKSKPDNRPDKSIQSRPVLQCLLCPNNLPQKALDHFLRLVPSEKGHVHTICYRAFPTQLQLNEIVTGMRSISKAQKNLKCGVCRHNSDNTHGACFQCTNPKCTRAYHATCALSDGVFFDYEGGEVLCKIHRPKGQYTCGVPGEWVQFTVNTSYFCGMVIENNTSEETYKLAVYPSLEEVVEVAYERVLRAIREGEKPEPESPVESLPESVRPFSYDEPYKRVRVGDMCAVPEYRENIPMPMPLTNN